MHGAGVRCSLCRCDSRFMNLLELPSLVFTQYVFSLFLAYPFFVLSLAWIVGRCCCRTTVHGS